MFTKFLLNFYLFVCYFLLKNSIYQNFLHILQNVLGVEGINPTVLSNTVQCGEELCPIWSILTHDMSYLTKCRKDVKMYVSYVRRYMLEKCIKKFLKVYSKKCFLKVFSKKCIKKFQKNSRNFSEQFSN